MDKDKIYQSMFSDYPDVVSAEDLRYMLGLSRTTIYQLLSTGKIESLKVGAIYRIPKLNVLKYLKLVS